MSVRILVGEVRDKLRELPDGSIDCCICSPPYWGLRSYLPASHPDKHLEIGLEPTLAEHLTVLVEVFEEVRRVLKPTGSLWLNYGDCYATTPNGRSAADTKKAGNDDRTFRDKPFSTIGPVYDPDGGSRGGGKRGSNKGNSAAVPNGRVVAGGYLKPKDLCMVPNRLAIALQDAGWWVRSEIVWGKSNPMPDSSGKYRPSTSHEKIFLLTKSANSFYDAEAVAIQASESTHARLAQNIQDQIGSDRANGGRKTNGNMKAVIKKQDGHGRRSVGFNARYDRKMADAGTGIRNNSSMDESLAIMPMTRYLRNYEPAPLEVWPIPTQPFSEAHFATFPSDLVKRCALAGTSAHGCCDKCGAPWVRLVKTVYENPGNRQSNGPRSIAQRHASPGFEKRLERRSATTGWRPTCEHYDELYQLDFPAPRNARKRTQRASWGGRWKRVRACAGLASWPVVRATICDPFGGSGTTALVADRLGRDCILIELNEVYADMAMRRIRGDSPLFAEVE